MSRPCPEARWPVCAVEHSWKLILRYGRCEEMPGHHCGKSDLVRIAVCQHRSRRGQYHEASITRPVSRGQCHEASVTPATDDHGSPAPNVSHDRMLPLRRPMVSHLTRWAEDPWVKLSGMATPRDCLCSRSSPMAAAVLIA